MVPCKNTAEEVSFEWSQHRISSTDSKVRTTLLDFGSEMGNSLEIEINDDVIEKFPRSKTGDILRGDGDASRLRRGRVNYQSEKQKQKPL